MKVFLDTNVLVSAFATKGICQDIFELVSQRHELILSQGVLKEFKRILITKFKYDTNYVDEILFFLNSEFGSVPESRHKPQYMLGDKSDEYILGSAIESSTEVLISGDKHFINNRSKIAQLEILTPREFW